MSRYHEKRAYPGFPTVHAQPPFYRAEDGDVHAIPRSSPADAAVVAVGLNRPALTRVIELVNSYVASKAVSDPFVRDVVTTRERADELATLRGQHPEMMLALNVAQRLASLLLARTRAATTDLGTTYVPVSIALEVKEAARRAEAAVLSPRPDWQQVAAALPRLTAGVSTADALIADGGIHESVPTARQQLLEATVSAIEESIAVGVAAALVTPGPIQGRLVVGAFSAGASLTANAITLSEEAISVLVDEFGGVADSFAT